MPESTEPDDPHAQLARLRRWQSVLGLGVVSFVLLMVVVAFGLGRQFAWLGLPFIPAIFWSSWQVADFKCPRCGDYFTNRPGWLGRYHNPLTQRCIHCKFPRAH